jgi:DNA polymerase (family 10)
MQNAHLARQFEELADYLELSGESIFKIRAYKKAAEAIADLPIPIELAAQNGVLEEIEGMGYATISKTKEFLKSGKISLLEKIKVQYPAGLLEVLRVPGLGPKKVQLLWKEKDIDSLEKFDTALTNGDLVGVAGFGAKTLENLKNSLRRLKEMGARIPITDASGIARRLKAALPDYELHDAGSLRRGCDTLGNLNFVAKTTDAEALFDAFAQTGLISEIVSRDADKIIGRIPPGIEVEIVAASPEKFGSVLFFQTGSREFVEGIDIGEFPDEESVFEKNGWPYIAPELREKAGVWNGNLPQLLEIADIKGDIHSHSTWSDGSASIEEMVQAAIERGYEYLAITDHSKLMAMANGLNAERLREQALEIAEVQSRYPDFKIFRGVECDILRDGTMDLDDEILSELDFVIGSVHTAFNLPLEEQTMRVLRAIDNPHVDMIAHPTGRVLGVRPPYDINVFALIDACAKNGTWLEINSSERLDLRDEYVFAAREKGVPIVINTDAHSISMLGNIGYGVKTARRGWCEKKNVINTLTATELQTLLGNEKRDRKL